MINEIKNMTKIAKHNNYLNTTEMLFEGTISNEWYKFSITIDNELTPTTTKYNVANCSEISCDCIEFDTIEDFKKELENYIDSNNIEYYQNNLKHISIYINFIRLFLNKEI